MILFRLFLSILIIGIILVTGAVGINHGWNLFPIFFRDIMALNWPGQFNFDFLCLLILSGLWISWRNRFSGKGILLGICGLTLGTMFLAPYLLFLSFQTKGNMKQILLGNR